MLEYLKKLKWDENGLISVIAQDVDTEEVPDVGLLECQ